LTAHIFAAAYRRKCGKIIAHPDKRLGAWWGVIRGLAVHREAQPAADDREETA